MLHRFFSIYLLVFLLIGCGPTEPDTLGDLLVRLDVPATGFQGMNFEVGVFPSEVLITQQYTSEMTIKTALLNEGQAVITNLLPGIYVVAIFNVSSSSPPRQVIQVVADEVTIVDFDLNPLNNN